MRGLLTFLGALLTTATAFASSTTVEGWEITRSSERSSPSCIMAGQYVSGTRLSILVNVKHEWMIGLSNSRWNLRKDGTNDIAAYVDGQFVSSGKALNLSPTLAVLPLEGAEPFRALQRGERLDLQTPHGNLNFSLNGTGKAMTALLECVRSIKPLETASVAPLRSHESNVEVVSQAEAAVMLTNLLNSAGIQGYRIAPPKKDSVYVSYSLPDGTIGLLAAARGGNTKNADDYSGLVINRWSTECKGDFVSAKQSVASTDGTVIRKVLATCKNASTVFVTETTIIRKPNGFLVELAQVLPSLPSVDDSGDKVRASIVNAAVRLPDSR